MSQTEPFSDEKSGLALPEGQETVDEQANGQPKTSPQVQVHLKVDKDEPTSSDQLSRSMDEPKNWFHIPFLVAFRTRFSEFFNDISEFGPQDIEQQVLEEDPSGSLIPFMCQMITLCMNRQKPVTPGQHKRALIDCVKTFLREGDPEWCGRSPLHGDLDFTSLDWKERLRVLRSLAHWCLCSSIAIKKQIDGTYAQRDRKKGDRMNPLSMFPLGHDAQNNSYWLVEGRETNFRLYQEPPKSKTLHSWLPVAGSADELRDYVATLNVESAATRLMVSKIENHVIPRVETAEIKRKRQEIAMQKRAALQAEAQLIADDGIAHRTRGKRVRYNYSSSEDEDEEDLSRRKRSRVESQDFVPESGAPLRRGRSAGNVSDAYSDEEHTDDAENSMPDVMETHENRSQSSGDENSLIVHLKYNPRTKPVALNGNAIPTPATSTKSEDQVSTDHTATDDEMAFPSQQELIAEDASDAQQTQSDLPDMLSLSLPSIPPNDPRGQLPEMHVYSPYF